MMRDAGGGGWMGWTEGCGNTLYILLWFAVNLKLLWKIKSSKKQYPLSENVNQVKPSLLFGEWSSSGSIPSIKTALSSFTPFTHWCWRRTSFLQALEPRAHREQGSGHGALLKLQANHTPAFSVGSVASTLMGRGWRTDRGWARSPLPSPSSRNRWTLSRRDLEDDTCAVGVLCCFTRPGTCKSMHGCKLGYYKWGLTAHRGRTEHWERFPLSCEGNACLLLSWAPRARMPTGRELIYHIRMTRTQISSAWRHWWSSLLAKGIFSSKPFSLLVPQLEWWDQRSPGSGPEQCW